MHRKGEKGVSALSLVFSLVIPLISTISTVLVNHVNIVNHVNSFNHVNILNHIDSVRHVDNVNNLNSAISVSSLKRSATSIPDGIFLQELERTASSADSPAIQHDHGVPWPSGEGGAGQG